MEEGDDMAFIQYLNFDGEDLPLPDSYEVEMEDSDDIRYNYAIT